VRAVRTAAETAVDLAAKSVPHRRPTAPTVVVALSDPLFCLGPLWIEHNRECSNEVINVGVTVQWRRRDSQAFRAERHRRIVNRLHIDAELMEKPIAHLFAAYRIPDYHGNNMARIAKMWNTSRI
jgi:hypothetical protein